MLSFARKWFPVLMVLLSAVCIAQAVFAKSPEGVLLATIPMAWAQYNTRQADNLEVVPWVLWDTVTYTSASTTQAVFFNAVRATLDLGNMTVASMLPSPYAFLIRAPRFYLKNQVWLLNAVASDSAQTGGFNDAQLLMRTGVFTITIGNKESFQAPLWMITSGGGAGGGIAAAAGGAATNVTVSYGNSGVPDPRAALTLWTPLVIDSTINFKTVLSWPAGAVTLEEGNTDICVAFDGQLSRPIQ